MIKRLTLLTRKPGTSREEFARYWTEVHGPLLASHPAVHRLTCNVTTAFARASVRNPDPDDPLRDTLVSRTPDGFVELWFADRAEMEAMYASDFGRALVADAERFVGALVTFIVEEHVVK